MSDFANEKEYADADTLPKFDVWGKPQYIEVPKINADNPDVTIIDDIFDTISVVKLETNDNCIVGAINSICILNDTIYILDAWKNKSVFVFDITGKFINKIGNIGNGTGEYVEPTSFSVGDDYLTIYDQWQHKVMLYGHDGSLRNEMKLPFACQRVSVLDNGKLLCYVNDADNYHYRSFMNYTFWQCDTVKFRVDKVGLFYEHGKYPHTIYHHFYQYNSHEYYFDWRSNIYYEITRDGKMERKYQLKFDIEPTEQFYTDMEYRQKMVNEGAANFVVNFIAFDKFAVYTLGTNSWGEFVFCNIEDKSSVHCFAVNVTKSMISRVVGVGDVKCVYNGNVVYSKSPELMLSDHERISSYNPDLWAGAPDHVREFDKKLLESLHEEDNDILVFAKIKEHFD